MFYIFLDIDGVLNRSSDWKKMYTLNTECIRCFAGFVKHLKREVNIVLTSSWRTGFSYNQKSLPHILNLERELNKYGLTIYGKTPVSKDNSREKEIQEYIDIFDVKEYIIIDDDKTLFPNTKDKLYITDARKGFTAQDTKILLRQLK